MSLEKSIGDRHQDEQDKPDQHIQKLSRRTSHSQPNKNVDFKNGTIRHSQPIKYITIEKTIKRNWTFQ